MVALALSMIPRHTLRVKISTDDAGVSYRLRDRELSRKLILQLAENGKWDGFELEVDDSTTFVTVAKLVEDLRMGPECPPILVIYRDKGKAVKVFAEAQVLGSPPVITIEELPPDSEEENHNQ